MTVLLEIAIQRQWRSSNTLVHKGHMLRKIRSPFFFRPSRSRKLWVDTGVHTGGMYSREVYGRESESSRSTCDYREHGYRNGVQSKYCPDQWLPPVCKSPAPQ